MKVLTTNLTQFDVELTIRIGLLFADAAAGCQVITANTTAGTEFVNSRRFIGVSPFNLKK